MMRGLKLIASTNISEHTDFDAWDDAQKFAQMPPEVDSLKQRPVRSRRMTMCRKSLRPQHPRHHQLWRNPRQTRQARRLERQRRRRQQRAAGCGQEGSRFVVRRGDRARVRGWHHQEQRLRSARGVRGDGHDRRRHRRRGDQARVSQSPDRLATPSSHKLFQSFPSVAIFGEIHDRSSTRTYLNHTPNYFAGCTAGARARPRTTPSPPRSPRTPPLCASRPPPTPFAAL